MSNSRMSMIIRKIGITDVDGFTSVLLNEAETSVIIEFISISATIESTSYNSKSTSNLLIADLPVIQQELVENPKTEISNPDPSKEPINGNNLNFFTYLLIFLGITVISLIIIYVIKNNNIDDGVAKTEIEDLLNLRLILIRTATGLPFYQENFAEYKQDPALVAGMSAALSSFFNEFESEQKVGFELM